MMKEWTYIFLDLDMIAFYANLLLKMSDFEQKSSLINMVVNLISSR